MSVATKTIDQCFESEVRQLEPINLIIKKIFFVLLIVALLFQNSFALLLCSLTASNASPVFYAKEMIVATVIMLMLVSRKKYNITKLDIIVLLLIASYLILSIINYNSIPSSLFGVKYFVVPMILYFIGRYWFKDIDSNTLYELLTVVIVVVIILALSYFFVDKNVLIDLNIRSVFESKGQDVESGRFMEGFPINFYSYYGDYRVMRLFGLFFDPLAAGFFLLPLLFFSRKLQSGKNKFTWKLIYVLLFILLLLTQTRAILLAYIATLIFIRTKGDTYKIISLKWIFVSIGTFIAAVAVNYEILIKIVDPSTWGHINAYYKIIIALKDDSILRLLIGKGIPENLDVGNESLFASMIVYNGILYFLLFNWFVVSAFKSLSTNINSTLTQVALSSMMAYYLASFTTEHWFATTSSGLFWILLGMAIRNDKKVYLLCGHKKGDLVENCHDLYALRS